MQKCRGRLKEKKKRNKRVFPNLAFTPPKSTTITKLWLSSWKWWNHFKSRGKWRKILSQETSKTWWREWCRFYLDHIVVNVKIENSSNRKIRNRGTIVIIVCQRERENVQGPQIHKREPEHRERERPFHTVLSVTRPFASHTTPRNSVALCLSKAIQSNLMYRLLVWL